MTEKETLPFIHTKLHRQGHRHLSLYQVSIGVQAGGKAFSEIIFFCNSTYKKEIPGWKIQTAQSTTEISSVIRWNPPSASALSLGFKLFQAWLDKEVQAETETMVPDPSSVGESDEKKWF